MKSRMGKQYKYLAAIRRHNKTKSAPRLTSNSHLQTFSFEANHRELHTATTTYTFNSPPIFRTSFKLYKGNFPAGTSLRSWDARFSIPFMGFFLLKPISIFSYFRLSSPTYSPLKRPLRLSPFCKGIYKYNRKTVTSIRRWRARWDLNPESPASKASL